MTGDELSGDANETRGICATGNLYEFEMLLGDKVVKRNSGRRRYVVARWVRSKAKSWPGNGAVQKQIPDFSSMTSKMNAKL